jgi:integrase
MPRLVHRKPRYRKHKATGLAVVTISGGDRYLGKHGSAESKAAYRQLIAEAEASCSNGSAGSICDDLTIVELLAGYLRFAERYFLKDGKVTSEVSCIRSACRPLKKLYARLPARDFGPLRLKAVREEMIKLNWARRVVNNQTARIKRMFKWAAENELLSPGVHDGLSKVSGLRRGRSNARETRPVEAVSEGHVQKILPQVSPQVAAMAQLQLLTGMRSGEVTSMRVMDIDVSNEVWEYRPHSHKTEHHDIERVIPLGPRAQEIIAPFLNREVSSYLFSPKEAEVVRLAKRHAKRKTPLSCGNRPGTSRKRWRGRPPRERFDPASYARAITRGCDAAFPPPDGLTKEELEAWQKAHRFHPHQLRHTTATRIRRHYGLEAAKCILGHTNIETTQIYAEMNQVQAVKIMAEVG